MLAQAIEYYSYDDYKHWEGNWELIDGIAYAMSPAPMVNHQRLATSIISAFYNQLNDCKECEVLGEVDYKVSDDTVLRPDIVLTCGETNKNYLTKAPKIVVEIISPSTAPRDEKYKFAIYEREKVIYYILVYPDDLKAKIYKLKGSTYDKEGDFLNEVYEFEDIQCSIKLDFDKVFERLR
jgi:Uma2 family endonuclease